MPNNLGAYSLSEMWDRIARALKLNQAQVNTANQAEITNYYPAQGFSQTDLSQKINEALVDLYSKVILGREDQFSITLYQSVQAGNHGPYGFPPNTLQVRYMDWLEPGSISWDRAEERHWIPMLMIDDPAERAIERQNRAPSWKYELSGTGFSLDRRPHCAWQNAIRMKLVVMPPELVQPTDYIQARFVRQMQQCVIYKAAYALALPRKMPVAAEMKSKADEWEGTLIATAENANHPASVVSQSSRMPANTYSGRRGGQRWGRRGW